MKAVKESGKVLQGKSFGLSRALRPWTTRLGQA